MQAPELVVVVDRAMPGNGGSADVVHGVGDLEGAITLRRADEVAPLVAHVAHDAVPGVHQLLPLARLVRHHRRAQQESKTYGPSVRYCLCFLSCFSAYMYTGLG